MKKQDINKIIIKVFKEQKEEYDRLIKTKDSDMSRYYYGGQIVCVRIYREINNLDYTVNINPKNFLEIAQKQNKEQKKS